MSDLVERPGAADTLDRLRAALAEAEKEKELYRSRWLACVTPEEASRLRAENERLTGENARQLTYLQIAAGDLAIHQARAAHLEGDLDTATRALSDLRNALEQAEACMSIVEPRSDKAEYLRILGVVRAALSKDLTANKEGEDNG